MINYNETLPDFGSMCICQNDEWIDEFNTRGLRVGFRQDDYFVSTYWDNEYDCFETDFKSVPKKWVYLDFFDAIGILRNSVVEHNKVNEEKLRKSDEEFVVLNEFNVNDRGRFSI